MTAPDLTAFDEQLGLGISGSKLFYIKVHVTDAILVPEPATLLLLVGGFVGFKKNRR